uniref:M56 family metallopeptidase n=1 Tax=Cellvibrio fontiphilus TaxID=1815559 RepID=UPI002B4BA65B|nr:M56 family metallopeptidase [Cellvibrio fontiphilus]
MDNAATAEILITGLVKPLVLTTVTLLLWLLVRHKSAALQHFVLSLGFISLLILPVIAAFAPVIPININLLELFAQWFPLGFLTRLSLWLEQGLTINQGLLVAAIYLLPATSLLAYLVLGIVGLWLQQKTAQEIIAPELIAQKNALCELIDVRRPVRLLTSAEIKSPHTWGFFRPVILLPRAALLWDEDKLISVLVHELGHVARCDWPISILVKVACAIFWFLLPLWWLAHQLSLQAEIAADDYIYRLRDKYLIYARNLLSFASLTTALEAKDSALYMRGHSEIHQRILAVLDHQRPHQPLVAESAQYWIVLGSLLLIIFSCVQWVPLREQMTKSAGSSLVIRLPELQDSIVSERGIRSERFSWELVQALKPAMTAPPASIEQLEHLHIEAPRPDKTELQGLTQVELDNAQGLQLPRIQVEGYLPLKLVTPEYPAQALNKGIEGWVEVEFTIDADGYIVNPQVIAHSPSAIFDRSVLSALKKSHYRPQLFDGQPIVVHGVTELFRFTLVQDNSSAPADHPDLAARRR